MRKIIAIISATIIICCCSQPLNTSFLPGRGPLCRPDIPGREWADSSDATEKLLHLSFYSWGVEVDSGIVWQQNFNPYGNCNVVFFRDTSCILRIPAGFVNQVGVDADQQSFIDGHIYTFCNNGSVTVIKKDGEELYRWVARESLVGMTVADGEFYILTRPKEGGFRFRRGDQILQQRASGNVGELYSDSGYACYANYYMVSGMEVWFISRSGIDELVFSPETEQVLAARYCGGALWTVSRKENTLMLRKDDRQVRVLDFDYDFRVGICEICPCKGDSTSAAFQISVGSQGIWEYIVIRGTEENRFLTENIDQMVSFNSASTVFLHQSSALGRIYLTNRNNRIDIPGAWNVLSQGCLSTLDGHIGLALSAPSPYSAVGKELQQHPAIWVDGKLQTLPIYGYLTGAELVWEEY